MKTRLDVAAIMARVFGECQETRESGQKEYAHDAENALRNFESLGADLQLPREKVLWVYMKKHLDGILAHINGHRSQREAVDGRIKDVIVYLILLQSMVEDDREAEIGEPGQVLARYAAQAGERARVETTFPELTRMTRLAYVLLQGLTISDTDVEWVQTVSGHTAGRENALAQTADLVMGLLDGRHPTTQALNWFLPQWHKLVLAAPLSARSVHAQLELFSASRIVGRAGRTSAWR